MAPSNLTERLAAVRLVVLDVDGVLTDGSITYIGDAEGQTFNVKDGLGIKLLQRAGVEVAWITGRGCAVTEKRAAELGVTELHMEVGNKLRCLLDVQERLEMRTDETLVMGDDLPDLRMRPAAALLACPANAVQEVRELADWRSSFNGGRGAVRDLCEALLRARDAWTGIVVDVTT